MTAVESTKPQQSAKNIGQVTAKDTTIGMDFIYHDVFQIFKELYPFGMMRQNVGMKHIGVGNDNMSGLTYGLAGCSLRIAIVGPSVSMEQPSTEVKERSWECFWWMSPASMPTSH